MSMPYRELTDPAPMADVARAAAVSIRDEAPAPEGSRQVPVTPAPASNASAVIPETPAPKRATGVRGIAEETPSAAGQGHQFSEAQLGALAALLQGSQAAGGSQEGRSRSSPSNESQMLIDFQTQTSQTSLRRKQ